MSESEGKHCVNIINRSHIELDGVEDVMSFDETSVVMRTKLGVLTLDGEELHIVSLALETGRVSVDGNICGLLYLGENESDRPSKGKKRLFGRSV